MHLLVYELYKYQNTRYIKNKNKLQYYYYYYYYYVIRNV